MRISELEGQRVAIWGYGREGRSVLAALRWRLPSQPVTVFCSVDEAASLEQLQDPALTIATQVDAAALSAFDVVVKSPGISPYTSPAADAALNGVRVIGATTLWMAEPKTGARLCVTGTKGKSTTTALIAHLLRAGGVRTALAGNIGLPLLELLDVQPPPAVWAIELSSYQAGEARDVDVAVVLNLFPEHLDWHGTEQRYFDDKLALVTRARPRVAVLNAADARLGEIDIPSGTAVAWFGHGDGWHLRDGLGHRAGREVIDPRTLPLPGRHNGLYLCAALAAIEALGHDAVALAPHASLAALDCFKGRRVAILVGGYDRGVDWGVFCERLATEPVAAVVTMGQNGPTVHEKLRPLAVGDRFVLEQAATMEDAVRLGLAALDQNGVLLLSPGAPSFPRYRDYTERGRHFARAAGFDPDRISAIPGLGVA